MKVVIFGGTGMIGQGVVRECLLDADVERVVSIVRRPGGTAHRKLREVVHDDFFDFAAIEPELSGAGACLFTLGVSSAGMSEKDYRRVTYDITLAAANTLLRLNPSMTFEYISGAGTGGRGMWARVKAETETALLAMPFRAAYMLRPALIQPLHGIRSRTRLYRLFYGILSPILPLLVRILPQGVTNTERLGRAMLDIAKHGAAKRVLESADINAIATAAAKR